MITSQLLKKTSNMLEEFEGRKRMSYDDSNGSRCSEYRDCVGYITIGVGHKVIQGKEDYLLHKTLTDLDIQVLLINDIFKHEVIAKQVFSNYENQTLSKKTFCLLMAFNLGNHLKSFKRANNHFNNGRYSKALKEYKNSLWYNQVGFNRANKTLELLSY